MNILIRISVSSLVAFLLSAEARADIYAFKGGIRIPAGSCASFPTTRGTQVVSTAGGLAVFNMGGPVAASLVCQVPVPEKARIRQFVLTGNVVKGAISAHLGGVRWNTPRQASALARVSMLPTTPYEVPDQKQKKVVQNVPLSGPGSFMIDRIQTYFIEAALNANTPLNIEDGLEIFYFEIYWD